MGVNFVTQFRRSGSKNGALMAIGFHRIFLKFIVHMAENALSSRGFLMEKKRRHGMRATLKYGPAIGLALQLAAGAHPAPAGFPAQAGKIPIAKPSDILPHTDVIKGKPSELVRNHETALALALQVEKNRQANLETFAGYIGQAPPEQTPQVFRLQTHEGYFAGDRIAISADGKELYYSEVTATWSDANIRYYKYSDRQWNGPFELFPGFLGPALSVDGQTMFFEKYNDSRTCWHSTRTGTGWSAPTLCTEVPDPKDKHYLQDTAGGRVYASSQGAPNGIGARDICTYAKTDSNAAYRSLGRPLNSPGNEGDFYVARDESFIVFGSPHRGGLGGGDLFISFRERDGAWSDPKNLGAPINTPGFEFGPYVTDDKRYLFFSRSSDFTRVDIYWVRFDGLLKEIGAVQAAKPTANAAGTFKTGLKGIYFGQALPGDMPVPFAPEILQSISRWVAGTAFSPDGTQLVVAVGAADYSGAGLYSTTRVNDEWTPVAAAPFASDFIYSNEPVFSSDGKTLTFTGRKSTGTQDLWTVGYADRRWGTPVALPSPINSAAKEFRGSYMADGTLYFTSARSGMYQVYRGYKDAAQRLLVELVGPPISTNSYDGDPCIAPDGRFLIFNTVRDRKSADLYVSFRDARGGWGTPINLGPQFNTANDEYGAHLSPDGKYLFFTRHTAQGNGIYWVAVSAIEKLNRRSSFDLDIDVDEKTLVRGSAPYLGQTPPGERPVIFAPGIISLADRLETYPAFSPDGKEMFFSVVNAAWTKGEILRTGIKDGNWIKPEKAVFSDNPYVNWESSLSPDGRRLFFASNRPPSPGSDIDLWMVERASDATWSNPVRLGSPVNTSADDGSACVTNNGTLYFRSGRGGGLGGSELYRSKWDGQAYSRVESLGGLMKTGAKETEPFMAPDESYMTFISQTRTGGKGGWDLWIVFQKKDGSWTPPVNMGPEINTAADEYGPRVTPDGKYLFFTREIRGKAMDIYWVSAKVIETLRTKTNDL
jgi:Tol biopolymer transport system component